MRVLLRGAAVVAAIAGAMATPARAQINSPVPTNATIFHAGLQWAWANPLPAASGLNLAFQATLGWRIPTLAELASAPLATDFMFAGANVPLGGSDPVSGAVFQATNANLTGDAACATPYFSSTFRHCDWQDGLGQVYGPWAGMDGAFSFADQLVVRNAQSVPEPASIVLLASGLALMGLGAARRRHV